MINSEKYNNLLKNIESYTNDEYLQLQVLLLSNIYYREIVAIKNIRLEYIAFSNAFSTTFGLTPDFLGKADKIPYISPKINLEIEKQELKLIKDRKPYETVLHLDSQLKNIPYLIKARPLINPSTQEVVGIIVFSVKIDLTRLRRMLLKAQKHKLIKEIPIVSPTLLTKNQQLVISCLLLGFHQRKTIATMLSKITKNEVNEILVKNTLQALYTKYSCNSTSELINLVNLNKDLSSLFNDNIKPNSSTTTIK